jgi:hypothetical protein
MRTQKSLAWPHWIEPTSNYNVAVNPISMFIHGGVCDPNEYVDVYCSLRCFQKVNVRGWDVGGNGGGGVL